MGIQRFFLLLLICNGLFIFCGNANADSLDTRLENSISKVVQAFHNKDIVTINQMISDKYGLVVLFRRGVFDEYKITDKIDPDNPLPEYLPYSFGSQTDFQIRYETLPTYDCDTYKWSKTGLYCDLINNDNLLSITAHNLKQLRGDKIDQKTIDRFKEMEEKSHRVVLIDKNGGALIFYLTLIENKWYLTILDRVSGDCSA
jgi:hypothetical protein